MNELNSLAANVVELLLLACGNAFCLAALVGVVVLLFSRWLAPKYRHALWLLVAIRMVLPISASSSLSLLNVFHFGAGRTESTLAAKDVQPSSSMRVSIEPSASENRDENDAPSNISMSDGLLAVSNHTSISFELWLVGLWACGAVLVSVWTVVNTRNAVVRIGRAATVQDGRLLVLLDDCRRDMRVRRSVTLRIVFEESTPAIAGFLRPKLLLPASMAHEFTDEELRLIFLHELGHLKRADAVVNWLLAVVRIAHWFNPLYWFVAARIGANREMACDALALEFAGSASQRAYGETLLRVAERGSRAVQQCAISDVAALAMFSRRKGLLKRRITMLPVLSKPTQLAARLLAVLLVVSAAVVGLTDAISQEKELSRTSTPDAVTVSEDASVPATNDVKLPNDASIVREIYDVRKIREWFDKLPVPAGQTSDEYFRSTLLNALIAELPSGSSDATLIVQGNELKARLEAREHKMLLSLLKAWEIPGTRSIGLTVGIISSNKNMAEKAGILWSRLEAPQISPSKRPHSLFAEDSKSSTAPVAEYVSARTYSVLSEALTKETSKQFRELCQADEKTNLVFAPKITIFNGQSADIADVVSRPFVVAIRNTGAKPEEPEIRNIEEGTRIQVRGLARDIAGPVRLDCLVQLNKVDDVKTASFRLGGGGRQVKVQVPSVTTERFHINTEVPLGRSLLISPLRTDDDKQFIYILIDAEIVDLGDNLPIDNSKREIRPVEEIRAYE